MSNKTQLQTNNTALDALITRVNAAKDVAASLPEAGAGGGGARTVSVTVNNQSSRLVHYWDGSQQIQTVGAGTTETVNALNGVLAYCQEMSTRCSGSYLRQAVDLGGVIMFIFLSDGGTMTCIQHSGAGGGSN